MKPQRLLPSGPRGPEAGRSLAAALGQLARLSTLKVFLDGNGLGPGALRVLVVQRNWWFKGDELILFGLGLCRVLGVGAEQCFFGWRVSVLPQIVADDLGVEDLHDQFWARKRSLQRFSPAPRHGTCNMS